MQLRANLDETVCVPADEQQWTPSPAAGVERILLDRDGDEVAVATSIVRYAPGSSFPSHVHGGGEEFVVLEGEFVDESQRYPQLTYARNPIGTAHAPGSPDGCVLFVKLRQFDAADTAHFATPIDPEIPASGLREQVLHEFRGERVSAFAMAAGARTTLVADYFAREILVIRGALSWEREPRVLKPRGWLRVAPGSHVRLVAHEPTLFYSKTREVFTPP